MEIDIKQMTIQVKVDNWLKSRGYYQAGDLTWMINGYEADLQTALIDYLSELDEEKGN